MSNEIIASWEKNAPEWINAIDSQSIASRKFTNAAILQFLRESSSTKILDIGCGEGWLTRGITAMEKKAVGLDAIGPLLENARQKGPESFYQISYEDIVAGLTIPEAPFDAAVFNFCLYQEKGLSDLFNAVKKSLGNEGSIVVQTLHPYFLINNGLKYESQRISDSWKGLQGNFKDGHPWYARTMEDWFSVFSECNMNVVDLREIRNDKTLPVSLILRANRIKKS